MPCVSVPIRMSFSCITTSKNLGESSRNQKFDRFGRGGLPTRPQICVFMWPADHGGPMCKSGPT